MRKLAIRGEITAARRRSRTNSSEYDEARSNTNWGSQSSFKMRKESECKIFFEISRSSDVHLSDRMNLNQKFKSVHQVNLGFIDGMMEANPVPLISAPLAPFSNICHTSLTRSVTCHEQKRGFMHFCVTFNFLNFTRRVVFGEYLFVLRSWQKTTVATGKML